MAMSDTGSSMEQWAGLYGHHGSGIGPGMTSQPASGSAADSSGLAVSSSPPSGGSLAPPPQQPSIEGRIGKSARRRSRASRRAPVTLLNTDTSNFRAMVQQFTGIPSGPYSSAGGGLSRGGAPVLNFGMDYGAQLRAPGPVMSFEQQQQLSQNQHQLQHSRSYQEQQQQVFRPQAQQLQQRQYYNDSSAAFAAGGYNNNIVNNGGGMSSSTNSNDGFSHGYGGEDRAAAFFESMAAQHAQMMPRAPASTNNSRVDGYFG